MVRENILENPTVLTQSKIRVKGKNQKRRSKLDLKTLLDHAELKNPINKNQKNHELDRLIEMIIDDVKEDILEEKQKIKVIPKSQIDNSKKKAGFKSKSEDSDCVCRKIRIYPTKEQKEFFNKCIGTSRYIYNNGVQYLREKIKDREAQIEEANEKGCIYINKDKQCCKDISENHKYFCDKHLKAKNKWSYYNFNASFINLRKNVLVNDADLSSKDKWQKDIPYDTRQLILKDLANAYDSALKNKINGNVKLFDLKFKSRKNQSQIFHIDKKALTTDLELFKRRKIGKLRTRRKMTNWIKRNINEIETDSKIIRYNDKSYYLLLTVKKEKDNKEIPFETVALDAGVRTFQTFYSPEGIVGKIGDNFVEEKLINKAMKVDKMDSVASQAEFWRTKRNIRNRQTLLRAKIKNNVNNLHWETVNFLCNNFKTIIISKFDIKNMTKCNGRTINNKVVRKMLTLSHGAFKEKLKSRVNQKGNRLFIVDEAYTSVTCGKCGHLKEDLGSNKVYKCDKCKTKIDRDINGARNILLRTLC
jgi:putative transposase